MEQKVDHGSLRNASTYINNLLLARGLLRDGEPVDFVKPSKESRAQIINLVHDLILREDRDREQRENVAITMRKMRADEAKSTAEIVRLKEKQEETARAEVSAKAAERTAQTELKKVEKAMKVLQDQTTKLKATLAQVKTQCANDVRKRDLELARLKTHLQGQQRGTKTAMTAPSITLSNASKKRPGSKLYAHDVDDPEYSLKQETTEFLTQLSQSLSDENDNLISLIRDSLGQLKELLGLPVTAGMAHPDSAIGSTTSGQSKHEPGLLHTLPTSYEALAGDMEGAMEHIKSVLSNPNFVSIEEVEVREEEILRLREGWERMERQWKEVLIMMNGWLSKINGGGTINIEDLRKGVGLVSPGPHNRQLATISESAESSFLDREQDESEIKLPDAETDESSMLLEPPRLSSLVETRKPRASQRQHQSTIEPSTTFDLRPESSQREADEEIGAEIKNVEDDRRLTVAEKLNAVQAEADEAAAAKSQESANPPVVPDDVADEGDDILGKMPDPVAKRTKIRGRPKRRKSTLSPEELEALIASEDQEPF